MELKGDGNTGGGDDDDDETGEGSLKYVDLEFLGKSIQCIVHEETRKAENKYLHNPRPTALDSSSTTRLTFFANSSNKLPSARPLIPVLTSRLLTTKPIFFLHRSPDLHPLILQSSLTSQKMGRGLFKSSHQKLNGLYPLRISLHTMPSSPRSSRPKSNIVVKRFDGLVRHTCRLSGKMRFEPKRGRRLWGGRGLNWVELLKWDVPFLPASRLSNWKSGWK